MVVVARIVMIRSGDIVRMTMRGVVGAVVGFCRHGCGTMLDGFNGGSDRQRQSKEQDRPKRP
jgi:hypothetical protein